MRIKKDKTRKRLRRARVPKSWGKGGASRVKGPRMAHRRDLRDEADKTRPAYSKLSFAALCDAFGGYVKCEPKAELEATDVSKGKESDVEGHSDGPD